MTQRAQPEDGFDRLARLAAGAPSRRGFLAALVRSGVAFAVGRPLLGAPAAGARSRPRARLSGACQPTNNISTTCLGINDYISSCGVICPDGGRLPGKGGCTIPNAGGSVPPWNPSVKKVKGKWCASVTVQATFTSAPQSDVVNWSPSEPPCCPDVCAQEIKAVLDQLRTHEQGHVKIINNAIAAANKAWGSRTFTSCGPSQGWAESDLTVKINNAYESTVSDLEAKFKEEPAQARPIDCSKCQPAQPGQTCCKGMCVGPCPPGQTLDPSTCKCTTQYVYCACTSTCYTDVQVCLSNCHATLGCFTGICGPADPGQCP